MPCLSLLVGFVLVEHVPLQTIFSKNKSPQSSHGNTAMQLPMNQKSVQHPQLSGSSHYLEHVDTTGR